MNLSSFVNNCSLFNLIHLIATKIRYNNLYTHFVFTTYERQRLITDENRVRIEKYITGIVSNNKSKLYAIYANPEHLHMLIPRDPNISEEEIATIIANGSERFVNKNKLAPTTFHWQQSASAFSVPKSDIERVCKYILHQPEHHKVVSFSDEYGKFHHVLSGYVKKIRLIRLMRMYCQYPTKVW